MTSEYELPPLPVPRKKTDGGIELFAEYSVRDYARAAIKPYQRRIEELESQLEAIGAGGVDGRRITPSNASAKITGRSQAYLDSNLDPDEHEAFISWAREKHGYPDYARLVLDSEWCQGAVAGWQGATDDRKSRGEPSGYAYRYRHHDGSPVVKDSLTVAEPEKGPSDAEIREVFLANGFTIKPGSDDLKPYVYKAARALLARYGQSGEPEGWQLVPKIPTHEMIKALWETITEKHETTDGGYTAMLAAAPKFGEE